MTRPASHRSSLARVTGCRAAISADLLTTLRAAWRQQRIVVARPEAVRDDWTGQALINEANRLYGGRPGGGR
jgi:hypothetical protein